jgi:hypothetical protein
MALVIPYLALLLMFFAAATAVGAQAVARRFGNAGLIAFWIATSAAFAAVAWRWALAAMPQAGPDVSFFFIPFLFLLVEVGAVAWYIAWSTRKGEGGRRQLAMGILVFTAALIPALFAAQIPDMIRFASR